MLARGFSSLIKSASIILGSILLFNLIIIVMLFIPGCFSCVIHGSVFLLQHVASYVRQ